MIKLLNNNKIFKLQKYKKKFNQNKNKKIKEIIKQNKKVKILNLF